VFGNTAAEKRITGLTAAAKEQSSAAAALRASIDVPRRPPIPKAASQARDAVRQHEDLMKEIQESGLAREREKVERQRKRDEHDALMIQLLAATSESTGALATNAADQERRINAQAGLTNLLAFAVVYDVVNGSFDDHTWLTTSFSAVVALVVVTYAGKWWARRKS
jgi:hypothetical protein